MIEKWRVPFLVATGVFFSAALYFAYRKTRCSSGSSCDESVKRNERLKHVAVSLVTVLVLTFLFLPEYIGVFAHEREAAVVERPFAQTTELYRIEGMTCVGCEGHVSATLEEIPGVTSVVVSYRNKTAEVRWNKPKNDTAVVKALAAIGYEASRN